jgi:hypothetical protein
MTSLPTDHSSTQFPSLSSQNHRNPINATIAIRPKPPSLRYLVATRPNTPASRCIPAFFQSSADDKNQTIYVAYNSIAEPYVLWLLPAFVDPSRRPSDAVARSGVSTFTHAAMQVCARRNSRDSHRRSSVGCTLL